MPETPIALFRDEQGHVPVQVWLAELELRRPKAFQKPKPFRKLLPGFCCSIVTGMSYVDHTVICCAMVFMSFAND